MKKIPKFEDYVNEIAPHMSYFFALEEWAKEAEKVIKQLSEKLLNPFN